jgi:hypothetical protein
MTHRTVVRDPAAFLATTAPRLALSVATVGAPVSDMRAKMGNEVAMKAFRAGTLPFPDGTHRPAGLEADHV